MKKSSAILLFLLLNACLVHAQWTAVNAGLPNSGTNTNVESFAVIGSNLFAATQSGVYLSTNNGATWTAVNAGLTNTDVEALVAKGNDLFAGTGHGIFLSTNNGSTWTSASAGLDTSMGTSVYSFFVNGQTVYAGTEAGVFQTTNNGTTWTALNTGLPITDIYAFAMIGNTMFAGVLFNGVYSTTGSSWASASAGLPTGFNADFESFAVIGSKLFAGNLGTGVYLSTNNGANWSPVISGLTDLNIQAMAVSGTNLFAGSIDSGVFLSTNYGANWTPWNSGLTDLNVQSLAVHGTKLFAGTGNGVFVRDLGALAGLSNIENEEMHLDIFPNPGSGAFHAESDRAMKATMEIYNVNGEKVMTTSLLFPQGDNIINMSDQPAGIYFYKILGEDAAPVGRGELILQK
jgi:ligand-binding sensor domain-containing protein